MNDYPTFDTKQFDNYTTKNPYIDKLEVKYRTDPTNGLSPEENEYLIKNFRFQPYHLDLLKLKIGNKSKDRIKKDFGIDTVKDEAYIDTIVGETDEWYHVSCKVKDRDIYFWLNKAEVGNIYEQNYDRQIIDVEDLNSTFLYELYDHQIGGVKFLLYNEKCFLLDKMGAGKTHTSIAATINNCEKVLIICICGKQIDWKRELGRWGQESKIIWTKKTSGWIEDNVKYTIIGNHVLRQFHESKTKKNPNPYQPLMEEDYDCIIVDEIQYFKNPKSQRSKVLTDLTSKDNLKYLWAMSGTMIEKNEELYNICRILNMSITDLIYTSKDYSYFDWYPKFESFIKRYCGGVKIQPKNGKRSFWIRKGNTNTHELHQRIKHLIRRKRIQDSIEGFPDKYESSLYFELSTVDESKYQKLFDEYMKISGVYEEYQKMNCEIGGLKDKLEKTKSEKQKIKYKKSLDKKQEKAHAFITKWLNVEHLVSAGLMRKFLANKKVKETVSFIKSEIQIGRSTIIYTNFIDELESLAKKFGNKAVVVKSGLGSEKKQEFIDEFMNNDDKLVLIGNVDSIGTGFNITKADNIYFNSLPWRSDIAEQAIGRSYRPGREEYVMVWYPIYVNTFEEQIYELVTSKSENRSIFHGEEGKDVIGGD